MISTKYLLADWDTGGVKGCVWWDSLGLCYKAEHWTTCHIIQNRWLQTVQWINNERGGGGKTKGNAFFTFWQWQGRTSPESTVSVSWGVGLDMEGGVGGCLNDRHFLPGLPQGKCSAGSLFIKSQYVFFLFFALCTENFDKVCAKWLLRGFLKVKHTVESW